MKWLFALARIEHAGIQKQMLLPEVVVVGF